MATILNILFTPGSFGSTVQTITQVFSKDYKTDTIPIEFLFSLVEQNGSMHAVPKSGHPGTIRQIEKFCNNELAPDIAASNLTTWICPFALNGPEHGPEWLLTKLKKYRPNDKFIFIAVNSTESAELNFLFYSYKNNYHDNLLVEGMSSRLLRLFVLFNIKWDYIDYLNWDDLSEWQLRNYFSDGYIGQAQNLIDSQKFISADWLYITTDEILNSPITTFEKVLRYSGGLIPERTDKFIQFSNYWRTKQQYVIDEYNLIKKIVVATQQRQNLSWEKLNFVSEAIIQQKLNIRLTVDRFPTNSIELYNESRKSK